MNARPLEQLRLVPDLEVGFSLEFDYCIWVRTNWALMALMSTGPGCWMELWQEGFVLPAEAALTTDVLAALVKKRTKLDPRVTPFESRGSLISCSSPVQPMGTEAVLKLWMARRPFLSFSPHLSRPQRQGELVDIGDLEEAELAELQLWFRVFREDVYPARGPESFPTPRSLCQRSIAG